jgi:hypothetical protein
VKPDEVGPFPGQQFVEPSLNFFLSFFFLIYETLENSAPPTGWLAGQKKPGGGSLVPRSLHHDLPRSVQQVRPPTSRPSRASVPKVILYKKNS